MNTELAIIVPYRKRKEHLERFIPHMKKRLPDAIIYVVEQLDSKPFNRAALLNYGAVFANHAHFVCHDVDHLPLNVDYTPTNGVTQLASNPIQLVDFIGGATMFDMDTFRFIGGYNGDYFSRGEDNELMFQLRRLEIPVTKRIGTFHILKHERPWKEFDAAIWKKAQQERTKNYLDESALKSVVISQNKYDYIHLKVTL